MAIMITGVEKSGKADNSADSQSYKYFHNPPKMSENRGKQKGNVIMKDTKNLKTIGRVS